MRRTAIFTALFLGSIGLVRCVGDDSGTPNPDASTNDVTSNDVTVSETSTTDAQPTDAGNDSGIIDSCQGFTDCPNDIEASSLQLWLRGNIGATCQNGFLTSWTDQSGKNHNASPAMTGADASALPPECGKTTINGQRVVTFTAPTEADAGDFTEFIDETLTVDLDFANSTDYTFFVVHERALDSAFGLIAQDNSFTAGHGHGLPCHGSQSDQELALFFGFSTTTNNDFALGYSEGCSQGSASIDTFTASTTEVDELVFSQTTGHSIFIDGVEYFVGDHEGNDLSPVVSSGFGAIGRGTNVYISDSRYRGAIAEIIGYSIALTPPERNDIEGYLKRQWGLSF